MFESDAQVHAYDPGSGRSWLIPGATHNRGRIGRDRQGYAVDLAGARLLRLADRPDAVAENGCVVQASGEQQPEDGKPARIGPWSLLCRAP